jgi:hypothetical protein
MPTPFETIPIQATIATGVAILNVVYWLKLPQIFSKRWETRRARGVALSSGVSASSVPVLSQEGGGCHWFTRESATKINLTAVPAAKIPALSLRLQQHFIDAIAALGLPDVYCFRAPCAMIAADRASQPIEGLVIARYVGGTQGVVGVTLILESEGNVPQISWDHWALSVPVARQDSNIAQLLFLSALGLIPLLGWFFIAGAAAHLAMPYLINPIFKPWMAEADKAKVGFIHRNNYDRWLAPNSKSYGDHLRLLTDAVSSAFARLPSLY